MEENLREIFSANKMYKISIIQELLTENNIESYVLNQKGSAFLIGDINLYVDEKDEAKALAIIKKHEM
ncbi:MAG: DUF2007 domain-containing protein [Bacteroidetes bacterium]|nr:DUF2007 domain-containing protein [Bacteroidota bacterium]MBL7103457.1 DUF2007 domain-containing protein [Bacteroidales bacterium]